jgi:hypothetical protein
LLSVLPAAQAQELEPRAYINVPVGLNFLLAGYANSEGGLSTDPSIPVEDAHLKIHTGLLAYARSLDLWGKSGKVDVILPYSELSGSARVAGQPLERNIHGLGDPRFRLSLNFYGAPALSLREFATYEQNLVIGASVQVSAPAGQYDSSRVVNLGSNRWSVKPDIGFSTPLGPFLADLTAGVTVFTRNDDYTGGKTREQDPIYSMQTNISYNFLRGAWAALGFTYYSGGRTTVNGVRNNDELNNSRAGIIVALPLDRQQSLKFTANRGISIRTGTDFTVLGVAWQYRWGAGF